MIDIHPLDMAELISSIIVGEVWILKKNTVRNPGDVDIVEINGVKYHQSLDAPRKGKLYA